MTRRLRATGLEGGSLELMTPSSITSIKQGKKLSSCSVVLIYEYGLRCEFKMGSSCWPGVCSVVLQSGTTLETEVSVWVVLDCTGGFCPQTGLRASRVAASHVGSALAFFSSPSCWVLPLRRLTLLTPSFVPLFSHHPVSKALGLVAQSRCCLQCSPELLCPFIPLVQPRLVLSEI